MTDPVGRARIHLALGWALHAAGQPALSAQAFEDGQRELAGADPELAVELDTGAMTAGMLDNSRAPEVHRRLEGLTELTRARTEAERHRHSQLAVLALFDGTTPAATLARFTLPILDDVMRQEDRILSWARWNAIGVLSWCDHYAPAMAACDELLAHGQRTGSALITAMASYARSWPALWTGQLDRAIDDARRAVDIWTAGAETYLPAAAYWLVSALAAAARTADAAAVLDEIDPDRWERTAFSSFVLGAQARVKAATGDLEDALRLWLACGEHTVERMHAYNPTLLPWRTEAALLAARLGQRDQARRLADEDVERAEKFGASRALGSALRARASSAPEAQSIAMLERAAEILAPSGAVLEHAATLIDLGAALRRAGRPAQAREPLRVGARLAERSGASVLVTRAEDELRAAGARPARRKDPTEVRMP